MHKTMKVYCFNCNTQHCVIQKCAIPFFQVFNKCFVANQLWLETMKDFAIHVLGYSIEHHVFIHFGLRYHNGIAHD